MTMTNAPRAGAPAVARPNDHPEALEGETRSARLTRMSRLIQSYPDIADADRRELADFLKHGSPDELALATYSDGNEPRVVAFKKDHPDLFKSNLRVMIPLLAILIVVPLLVLIVMLKG